MTDSARLISSNIYYPFVPKVANKFLFVPEEQIIDMFQKVPIYTRQYTLVQEET